MRWSRTILATLLIFVGGAALLVVGGLVTELIDNGLRRLPPGRAACRLGRHRRDGRYPRAGACVHETFCTTCGRVLRTDLIHEYDQDGDKNADCVRIDVCRRCGDRKPAVVHRVRTKLGEDLTDEERARVPSWRTVPPCGHVEICDDCGHHDVGLSETHDPPFPTFGDRCRRCGHWNDDGD